MLYTIRKNDSLYQTQTEREERYQNLLANLLESLTVVNEMKETLDRLKEKNQQ